MINYKKSCSCTSSHMMSQDNCLGTTNFDMEILTSMGSIVNTDLLIRLVKDQAKEKSTLQNQLSSLNTSAMQIKSFYSTEKKKNELLESENRELQLQLAHLKEEHSVLNNNFINNTAVHGQEVAGLENQLTDQSKQLIVQGNILQANNLSNKDVLRHVTNAKEFLKKRGESFEDIKNCVKNRVAGLNVATMTESNTSKTVATMTVNSDRSRQKTVATMTVDGSRWQNSPSKTYCDKSTMHSPMKSTATRGTTTSTFIKKVDVGTNYPEPISIEEIFRIMIVDLPPMITPIEDLPSVSVQTQTLTSQRNCSTGTMTQIKNIRRKINYVQQVQSQSPATPKSLYPVKMEEDSLSDSISNLGFSHIESSLPINRKLTNLWQIVGQMIFSIVGNGQVFDQSDNMKLINENLMQIRRVIEREKAMESQLIGESDDHSHARFDDLCSGLTNEDDFIVRPGIFSTLNALLNQF